MGLGKRMPYEMPAGVLEAIETNVLEQTQVRKRGSKVRRVVIAVSAVAASVAIAVTIAQNWHSSSVNSLNEVRQAFANLDNADRAFLYEIYDEDTFLNMNY